MLLDVLTEDRRWSSWSMLALAEQGDRDLLAINPIIYAEVSIGFVRIEEIDAALPPPTFHRLALPWDAAFLAGKCFLANRRRGGVRSSPLPAAAPSPLTGGRIPSGDVMLRHEPAPRRARRSSPRLPPC